MFGQFYNGSMRNMVVAFGSLFNDVIIKRTGASETIRVPLAYGPKEKYLRRNGVSFLCKNSVKQTSLSVMLFL